MWWFSAFRGLERVTHNFEEEGFGRYAKSDELESRLKKEKAGQKKPLDNNLCGPWRKDEPFTVDVINSKNQHIIMTKLYFWSHHNRPNFSELSKYR